MKSSPMAGWLSNNQKPNSRTLEGNEMVTGLVLSQKLGVDLMQNCDLPPPLKVFAGSDKTVITSMNRICSMMGRELDDDDHKVELRSGTDNEKLKLLKALRLSQTRAREAERKGALMAKEKDCLSNALLEESLRLFAYRQWVQLLELQVTKLQTQRQQQQQKQSGCGCCCQSKEEDDSEDVGGVTWIVALALCLGIAGVGFAFGFRYLF